MHQASKQGNAALRARLSELLMGNFVTQLIYVAAKLGIADLLKDGPKSAAELAAATGAHARTLYGMLRALASYEIFAESDDGNFSLTPMAELLQSAPGWRSQAILIGEEYYRSSVDLLHTAKTGKPAFDHVHGTGFYDYFCRNAEAGRRFNEVITQSAPYRYADLVALCDFSCAGTLVDVGGGYGGLTCIVLKANPKMRAILFDLPEVIAAARDRIAAQGLADRCELVAGDFFRSVPGGGDAYLLSSVITNWDDERAVTILRNCRNAMTKHGKLLMVEHAFAAGRPPSRSVSVIAVAAWAVQGSLTRTESEYRSLLKEGGFELTGTRPLSFEPYALMQAVPR